ncbi:hypothetical protein AAMO2058_000271300 [Amorphochlora amoebiformis]
MWIFVRFLFYHAAYPISLPFVFLFDGSCFAYNMAFLPTADRRGLVVFGMQIVTAVVLWMGIGFYFAAPDPPDLLYVIIPLALYMMHKLMIATKYAVLDANTHEWLRSGVIPREILQSIEMAQWRSLDIEKTHAQLRYTATQKGIDTESLFFYLHKDVYEQGIKHAKCAKLQEIANFYEAKAPTVAEGKSSTAQDEKKDGIPDKKLEHDGDMWKGNSDTKGLIRVPVLPIANRLIAFTLENTCSYENLIPIPALIQAMLPIIITLADGRSFGDNSSYSVAAVVMAAITVFIYFSVALTFLDTGRVDNQRRARVIQAVGALIDYEAPLRHKNSMCGMTMFIDLAWPQNVSTWMRFRWLLLNLGGQYRARITLYTSYVSVLTLGLIMYALIGFFLGTVNIVTVCTVAWSLLCLGYFLGSSIWYGSATNEQFTTQARSISRIQLKLREIRADYQKSHKFKSSLRRQKIDCRLKRADMLLETALLLLDHDSKLEPVTILGFEASKELYTTMATLVGGAVGAILVEVYFNASG